MLPMSSFIIGAAPLLILASLCGLALYYLFTDKKRKLAFGQYYNHPDKELPLYNMGHCDRYSAGTFSW